LSISAGNAALAASGRQTKNDKGKIGSTPEPGSFPALEAVFLFSDMVDSINFF
jgi:hypothetical protein